MPKGVYDRNSIGQPGAEPAQTAEAPQASPRAQETRRDRRRRDDGDLDRMARMKLAIPRDVQEQAKREGKTLRWMLDTPGRIQEVTANDWDKVEGVAPVAASRDEDTQLVLYSKYQDWYDEDQRKNSSLLDEREKAIMRGSSTDNRQAGDGLIVPKGQVNRISRERGV